MFILKLVAVEVILAGEKLLLGPGSHRAVASFFEGGITECAILGSFAISSKKCSTGQECSLTFPKGGARAPSAPLATALSSQCERTGNSQ